MTASMPARPATSAPAGSIYDLGYRGYEGPRLGRRAAVGALFTYSLRWAYGLGRNTRAKVTPMILAGLALLPAVFAVGFAALVSQAGAQARAAEAASPVRYDTYANLVSPLVMLFCAAQAPELFGRDQRYGVLPLYFTRALSRIDYAVARTFALMVAILVVLALPYLLLFVGRVMAATDPFTGLGQELPKLPPSIAQAALTAGVLGGIGAVISAWTPRRAYAITMIIAAFLIPPVLSAIIVGLPGSGPIDLIVLTSAGDILDATNALLFDVPPDGVTAVLRYPDALYLAAALVIVVGSLALVIRRYQRIVA
jgi:ABC-2 type transport system permease protein